MSRTPSERLFDSYKKAEVDLSNDYSEQLRLYEVEQKENSSKRRQQLNEILSISMWIVASLLFGLQCFDDYANAYGIKIALTILTCIKAIKNIYEFVNIPNCSIALVPTITRILRKPMDFDVISNPNITVDNISIEPKIKRCNLIVYLLRRKIITMQDIVNAINKTNKNVVEGFAYMGTQFAQINDRFAQINDRFAQINDRFAQIDKRFAQIDDRFAQIDKRFDNVEFQLKQQSLMLTLICEHLNIPTDALTKQLQ